MVTKTIRPPGLRIASVCMQWSCDVCAVSYEQELVSESERVMETRRERKKDKVREREKEVTCRKR